MAQFYQTALVLSGLVFSCLFPSELSAQFDSYDSPYYWLKPEGNVGHIPDNQEIFPNHMGAYGHLDFSDSTILEVLDRMKTRETGTFFVVYRIASDNVKAGERLLELGPISIYRNSLNVYSRTHPIQVGAKETHLASFDCTFSRYAHMFKDFVKHPDCQIAEIIYYDDILDDHKKVKVNSYLAMKYSINITKGTQSWSNPALQHYLSLDGDRIWDSQLDSAYDAEVMALGRSDQMEFLQTNTYTSDSKDVQLQMLGAVGHNGALALSPKPADNSLLVLSRRKQNANPPLELGPNDRVHKPWKIRLLDWSANSSKIRLTLDTLISASLNPRLQSNGQTMALKKHFRNGRTYFDIPIDRNAGDRSMYLLWGLYPAMEDQIARWQSPAGGGGRISLDVPEESLPARLLLIGEEEKFALTLKDTHSSFYQLKAGRYRLVLENEFQQMIDTNIVVSADEEGGCRSTSMRFKGFSSTAERSSFLDQLGGALEVYPNPIQNGESGRIELPTFNNSFQLSITSSSGQLLQQLELEPSTSSLPYSFEDSGVYLLECSDGEKSYCRKVVVH